MTADPLDVEMVDAYLEHLRRAGCTDATLHGRREILTRLNRDLPYGLGRTTDEELAAWLYRDGLSQNTKFTYYQLLRSFYGWAVNPKDQRLTFDPTEDLEPVKPAKGFARAVTDEQLHRVLAEAAEPFRTWATIAAYQGLRCIEISRLDREHITEQQLIVVRGKGDKPRVCPTHPRVWAAVRDLPPGPIARTPPPTSERASPFYVSSYAALHFRRKLHMPGVSMHRFRHWLGVTMQRKYKNVAVTAKVLGHASLSSTRIYIDATDDEVRAAQAMLPDLAG